MSGNSQKRQRNDEFGHDVFLEKNKSYLIKITLVVGYHKRIYCLKGSNSYKFIWNEEVVMKVKRAETIVIIFSKKGAY